MFCDTIELMSEQTTDNQDPPKIKYDADGRPMNNSIADVIEWFLNYDERTARMRHPNVNELFAWKQADDEKQGVATFPFENAEARFAIGVVQAIAENSDEQDLQDWITNVLEALGRAREMRGELDAAYKLSEDLDSGPVAKAERLPSNAEKRLYLSASWLEALCTAEARVLGWIYQEIYSKQYSPQ